MSRRWSSVKLDILKSLNAERNARRFVGYGEGCLARGKRFSGDRARGFRRGDFREKRDALGLDLRRFLDQPGGCLTRLRLRMAALDEGPEAGILRPGRLRRRIHRSARVTTG